MMKFTRHEITLLGALMLALVLGAFVQRFRAAHPAPAPPAKPVSKK